MKIVNMPILANPLNWLIVPIIAIVGLTAVSLVTFLIPPSAIILGALVLHESLTPLQWLGMALIGLGLAAVDGRLLQALSARQP